MTQFSVSEERIILALDKSPFEANLPVLDSLHGRIKWIKVGMRSVLSEGPSILREINNRNLKIFLDLKLHDIPSTVASTLQNLLPFGFDMITLHIAGGRRMLESCREVVENNGSARKPLLMGVTLLTSLDHTDIRDLGVIYSVAGHVKRLAEIAQQSGCDGVIASGGEVGIIRKSCGDDFRIVTPGIRPGAEIELGSDQRRVMSPGMAIKLGSDQLVVGRPIYGAENPVKAFDDIVGEISSAGRKNSD
ncbi:MAG TPA: orotidine-5'-phosphate decarboxylase [Firmicutes bacterium]|nr:orotidine-5'-phosphate decarboxylase [Bacillota bacterium]